MELQSEDSFRSMDVIENFQGIVTVARGLPDIETKIHHVKQSLVYVNVEEFSEKMVEIDSASAFTETNERPKDYRDSLNHVQVLGRTGAIGKMLQYLIDEEIPLDDLGVIVYEPVFIGFDAKKSLGYSPQRLKLPVMDIIYCINRESD
jgi:hypothetical protein